jgi:hypothetical protein
MTGASSWQQSGKEEHAKGEAEYKAAQTKVCYIPSRIKDFADSIIRATLKVRRIASLERRMLLLAQSLATRLVAPALLSNVNTHNNLNM